MSPATYPSRIFGNGPATTLYITIPAQAVLDSQFPFAVDGPLTVTIEDGRLLIASDTNAGARQ